MGLFTDAAIIVVAAGGFGVTRAGICGTVGTLTTVSAAAAAAAAGNDTGPSVTDSTDGTAFVVTLGMT